LKIEAVWSKPINLEIDKSGDMIFLLDLDVIPPEPGTYVFGRQYDGIISPIYIGETANLKKRAGEHLKSLPLMRAIEKAKNGERVFIFCTVKAGTAEKAKKQVKIIEKALILHAQSEGHELRNLKAAKLPFDEIQFTGNRASESFAPRRMLIKKALT
jgi:predicted GIY-YIG superfamily endonuclease